MPISCLSQRLFAGISISGPFAHSPLKSTLPLQENPALGSSSFCLHRTHMRILGDLELFTRGHFRGTEGMGWAQEEKQEGDGNQERGCLLC